jgi:hypothetical protein
MKLTWSIESGRGRVEDSKAFSALRLSSCFDAVLLLTNVPRNQLSLTRAAMKEGRGRQPIKHRQHHPAMNPTSKFTREELHQIVRSQRGLIGLILVNLLVALAVVGPVILLGPESRLAAIIVLLARVIALILGLIAVFFIFRMAKALRKTAWVYALAAFFPCIGLVTLLLVNHYATQTLRANGVRVGLLGARQCDLENIPPTTAPPPLS